MFNLKTTNFVALCNKALDAGYIAIVVLSGLHNSEATNPDLL